MKDNPLVRKKETGTGFRDPETVGVDAPDTRETKEYVEGTLKEGVKYDAGKPRYDLIPPEPMHALAELYGIGAVKYADRNWEQGMKWGKIFRAMLGHAWKWWAGETYDKEDGQHHLSSVAWCAFALMAYEARGIGTDDRSESNTVLPS